MRKTEANPEVDLSLLLLELCRINQHVSTMKPFLDGERKEAALIAIKLATKTTDSIRTTGKNLRYP